MIMVGMFINNDKAAWDPGFERLDLAWALGDCTVTNAMLISLSQAGHILL